MKEATEITDVHDGPGFKKELGLTSATALVMGSMVGSGIYIVAADMARILGSPALLIGAWLITGVMTIIGALSYGELAAMLPSAGGQYVFLRESLGPIWGFLYGWTFFLAIQCGTIAAVGVAFGKFLGVFLPSISSARWLLFHVHIPLFQVGGLSFGNLDFGLNAQNAVAIASIALLSFANIFTVKLGAAIQNVLTIAKILAMLGFVFIAYFLGRNSTALVANFGAGFWKGSGIGALHYVAGSMPSTGSVVTTLTALAIAQVGSLFAADAWNSVTFAAAEVRNPSRNLPLSLAAGSGVVISLYVLVNLVYLAVLPLFGDAHGVSLLSRGIQFASEDRVATAVMQQSVGATGAYLMAAAILLSTLGANNGLILSGARCYFAMARDGLFFKAVGRLHPRYRTPHRSLLVQAVWASILCLSGTYSQLLDYTMFCVLLFYILTLLGLFVLRRSRPEAHRPYRAFGYPYLPAIYIIMAGYIALVLLRYKPQYTWPGLLIVLLGVPVYFIWRPRPMDVDPAQA